MMDLLTVNDTPGRYPASYYAATATPLPPFAAPQGDLSCDVCVVGGGYTGLSTALHLAQAGYDVIVLEAQRLGFGASGRNGGQVSVGHRLDQDSLERMQGPVTARMLWDLGLDGVALVKSLIHSHGIEAQWRDGILHAAHRARHVPDLHTEADHLASQYAYPHLRKLDRAELRAACNSPAYHGGTLDMGSGHLHPLRYALGLGQAAVAAGVRVFEGARVTQITQRDPATVRTAQARITARHVAVCANGYLGNLSPRIARRVMPINSYIAATRPLSEPEVRALLPDRFGVADTKFVVNYFRLTADNRLLFGGGETYGYRFPADIAAFVRRPLATIFPQHADIQIDYAWGGTLAITMSRLPHFTRLSGNILSASGFSGHGVALSTLAGRLMAQAVQGQAEKFDLMASLPTPVFPGGTALRHPLLVLAMLWYGLRDRL